MIYLKEKLYTAIHKYMVSNNEFSKRFTMSIRNFMFVHVSASFVAVITLSALG